MAYYTRSKFNFAQNILTVQRPGRIPFTIVFAQLFHILNQLKLTSYWLYRCLGPTPSPPPKFAWSLLAISPGYYSRPKRNRRQLIRQWLCIFFFWCGGSGGGGKQGALWSMWKWWIAEFLFSYHSAIPEKFSKTTLSLHMLSLGKPHDLIKVELTFLWWFR